MHVKFLFKEWYSLQFLVFSVFSCDFPWIIKIAYWVMFLHPWIGEFSGLEAAIGSTNQGVVMSLLNSVGSFL